MLRLLSKVVDLPPRRLSRPTVAEAESALAEAQSAARVASRRVNLAKTPEEERIATMALEASYDGVTLAALELAKAKCR